MRSRRRRSSSDKHITLTAIMIEHVELFVKNGTGESVEKTSEVYREQVTRWILWSFAAYYPCEDF